MKIPKCYNCGFPTIALLTLTDTGPKLPFCKRCKTKLITWEDEGERIAREIEKLEPTKKRTYSNYKFTQDMQNIAVNLRKAGMTYKDIAQKIGVSTGTIFQFLKRFDF